MSFLQFVGISATAAHKMHVGAHAGLFSCKCCLCMQNLDAASLESYVQRLQDHFCKGSKSGSNVDDDQVLTLPFGMHVAHRSRRSTYLYLLPDLHDLHDLHDISAFQYFMQKLAHVCSVSEAVFLTTQTGCRRLRRLAK